MQYLNYDTERGVYLGTTTEPRGYFNLSVEGLLEDICAGRSHGSCQYDGGAMDTAAIVDLRAQYGDDAVDAGIDQIQAALAVEQRPAQIVITVPRATKGAWVRASRARGQKLTDWIVERVQRDD